MKRKEAPATESVEGKLWGGRFDEATDALLERLNDSIDYDRRLWKEDITGSRAYANALRLAGLLSDDEQRQLDNGLQRVAEHWERGEFERQKTDEDVHTANESRLSQLVGASLGGRLHTGRSRNDQVATDVRLWLRAQIDDLLRHVLTLIEAIKTTAANNRHVLMAGFTHLQPAQPVRFAHWLLLYAWRLQRDVARLEEARARTDFCPLGSGALAGNPFGIDRHALAAALQFSGGAMENSMDAVSSRDFILDFLHAATSLTTSMSQLSEDLILHFTAKRVLLADKYCTGSSLMPQKKNPDSLELIRAKSSRLLGHYTHLVACIRSLPSTYNKDLQEDKEALFDAVDTSKNCVTLLIGIVATLRVDEQQLKASLTADMLATDFADYLVRRGVPFRRTHAVAGALVRRAEQLARPLSSMTAQDIRSLDALSEDERKLIGDDVVEVWSFERSCEARASFGGTALAAVDEQLRRLSEWLASKQTKVTN